MPVTVKGTGDITGYTDVIPTLRACSLMIIMTTTQSATDTVIAYSASITLSFFLLENPCGSVPSLPQTHGPGSSRGSLPLIFLRMGM